VAKRKRKNRRLRSARPAPQPGPLAAAPQVAADVRARTTDVARRLAGGRLSVESAERHAFNGAFALLAPLSAEHSWRSLSLDDHALDTLGVAELLELLADLSPDISRALWDFLRLCNPGWEAVALLPDSEEPDEAAQAVLDDFIGQLTELYGSLDVVIGRLFMGAFIRGGFFAELVLDERGRRLVDLVTPDPDTVRFRRIADAQRGPIWQLCQYDGLHLIDLDRPTILYIPVDPLPGVPYGRSLVAPALFGSLFLLSLLHDLRRVVAQQGYPRIDLSISLERLHAAMPAELEDDPEAVKKWVDAMVREVQNVYASLQPDDAYIHTDVINVNRPVGTVDSSSLGAVDGLIRALERMITRALKTMPLLMADTASTSEANANRQWEVHAAGIKSLQHLAESLLQRLFSLALQAQGIQTTVQFRFAELRAAELLRDAQTEALQIANVQTEYAAGWISQDEAALKAVGHESDQPAPRVQPQGWVGELTALLEVQAEPGGNRSVCSGSQPGLDPVKRIKIIPDGAAEELPAVPDEVEITDADERRAIDAWDAAMPAYAGLLEAAVVGREDWDTAAAELPVDRAAGQRAYGDESPWVWEQAAKRYRNQATGQTLNPRQMLVLRDQFVDAQKAAAAALAERLAAGDITLTRFMLEMRELIKTTYYDEYVLGHGGRRNMTHRDNGIVGRLCREQYQYLQAFMADIAAGNLSPAQIRARCQLYIESASQAYERAAAEVRGLRGPHALPAYPGDHSTQCGANCRCTWEFRETETAWECTWTLHPAEHCPDCLERSVIWAPYSVPK